ncbi:hypothetical protein FB446DRAFT_789691 [Lentinula raphanica]|nr:hypothetical protein FB446DRAFT_789691 [Lentinula raphanica]
MSAAVAAAATMSQEPAAAMSQEPAAATSGELAAATTEPATEAALAATDSVAAEDEAQLAEASAEKEDGPMSPNLLAPFENEKRKNGKEVKAAKSPKKEERKERGTTRRRRCLQYDVAPAAEEPATTETLPDASATEAEETPAAAEEPGDESCQNWLPSICLCR